MNGLYIVVVCISLCNTGITRYIKRGRSFSSLVLFGRESFRCYQFMVGRTIILPIPDQVHENCCACAYE